MAEQSKKIVSVEILHLDEIGYGPEGKHTRREWRAECLEKLLAGKEQFLAWQLIWQNDFKNYRQKADLSLLTKFDDGSTEVVNNLRNFFFENELSLDFSGHHFEQNVYLENHQFLLAVDFSFATFECANFEQAIFEKFAGFEAAIFRDYARFVNISFDGDARFDEVIFNRIAAFSNTIFRKQSQFQNTIFERVAVFANTIFESAAVFPRATFKDLALFSKTKFKSSSLFESAKFFSEVDFENAVFENVGHFEGAFFLGFRAEVPRFRGCKIDSTRLEFSDESHFPQEDFSEDAIKNISFLKRLSDEHGQTDQALNFNAMELRAKRKNSWQTLIPDNTWLNLFPFWVWQKFVWLSVIFSGQFWFCVFTYLYEKVSDFGRSFTSPLRYLVFIMLLSYLFGVVSAFENSPAKATHSRQPIFEELARVYDYNQPNKLEEYLKISGYRAATEYSLYRSGNFLDFTDADKNTASINMRLFGSEIEPWWARIFGFVKGIFTAILLFLIALGLRNKYRVS